MTSPDPGGGRGGTSPPEGRPPASEAGALRPPPARIFPERRPATAGVEEAAGVRTPPAPGRETRLLAGGSAVPVPDVGDHAPDAELLDPATGPVMLRFAWSELPAVIVFLRYFGCPFCQRQVVALRDDRDRLREAGAAVVLIGQGEPDDAARFEAARQVPFPILLDGDRSAYAAYGLGRGSSMQVFGPRVALPFLRANLHRETLQRGLEGGSFWQMPGTFVVDTAGIIRLAHRNRTVADNPSNDTVLEALAACPRE